MTFDERLHYLGGFSRSLPHRWAPKIVRYAWMKQIYLYGWAREMRQHRPNKKLTPHQISEARAWGDGAAKALRLDPLAPVPPYPTRRAS